MRLPNGIDVDWITPNWPAPANVRAVSTTRAGGMSEAAYASLNLGLHVGDEDVTVQLNRRVLAEAEALPSTPVWLEQVHGVKVVDVSRPLSGTVQADASVSLATGRVCAIMTADCLPLLFTNTAGTAVAAAHAGWRGLAAGVLPATIAAMRCPTTDILAWLGPAIGPQAFEVGHDVRDVFLKKDAGSAECFKPQGERWLADIYALARRQLRSLGVGGIYGGEYCTYSDAARFFSYRRDGVCGRMASLIWLQ